MKKKPSMIFSILLNTLNDLNLKDEYSVNEISEKSGLHWKTTNEYIGILFNIMRFAPKIKLNDVNGKIIIKKHSSYYEELTNSQKILMYLFENKAFNEETAISISNFEHLENFGIYTEDLILKEQISKINELDKYYILKSGEKIAHSILSKITKKIYSKNEGIPPSEGELEFSNTKIDKLNKKIDLLIEKFDLAYNQNDNSQKLTLENNSYLKNPPKIKKFPKEMRDLKADL